MATENESSSGGVSCSSQGIPPFCIAIKHIADRYTSVILPLETMMYNAQDKRYSIHRCDNTRGSESLES